MKSAFFNEEHEAFRSAVRQFMEREVAPNAGEWEREERIPRSIWHQMADNDLLGINYPEEFGGINADFFFSVVFLEELARGGMGGFTAAVGVHEYMALAYIHQFGSRLLKENYLGPGIRGEKIGALAITEPNTGSDVSAIRTRAVRQGDHFIINGGKTFITNGVYGDFIVLAAKTDPEAGPGGISLFVVDSHSKGVDTRKLKKIGWNSSDTAEISFDDVKVFRSHLIGQENMGFYYIMECFQLERLVAAITAAAGADYCLEITLKYIREREAFNRPLAKFQAIRHALSDLATELEAARQLTYHACWKYKAGIPAIKECSMAKLYATELAKKVADACLQYFGGYGYMEDYLIARAFRDARAGTIVGGTSEIMREIIAKVLIDEVEYRAAANVEGKKSAEPVSPPPPAEPEKAHETPEIELAAETPADTGEIPSGEPETGSQPETVVETVAPEGMDTPKTALAPEIPIAATNGASGDRDAKIEMEELLHPGVGGIQPPRSPAESILYSLPERFRADKAGNYQGIFHFKLSGNEGGDYTVTLNAGRCSVEPGLTGKATCVLESSARTYLDMETGKTNPQIAFMMGKVKISNVPEMMQFLKFFRKLPDT
ncbi:MAG: acyl-CoA dehydrogenase family protein [Calditrichaceae bacterium]|nr:acyl-CoA dehydrogenase family protein [Calditrichaceae bacterium]